MANNGVKEVEQNQQQVGGLARRVKQSLFERELLEPGATIEAAITRGVFHDERALNIACLYLDHLQKHHLTRQLQTALYKINGTPAIGGQARKQSVMAHGNLYFPDDASKKEKEQLSKMQYKYRRDEEDEHDGKVREG